MMLQPIEPGQNLVNIIGVPQIFVLDNMNIEYDREPSGEKLRLQGHDLREKISPFFIPQDMEIENSSR